MKLRRNLFLSSLLAVAIGQFAQAGTTWDGGGGDTNINTAANWDDNLNPTLTGGTSTLTFGTGGSTATINTNVSLAGIVLNRDANFEIANGAGSLTIGSGGIGVTLPSTTGRTHTVSESSLILGASQSWTVTNNTGAAQLNVSSVIDDGASSFAITKLGTGTLVLSNSNTFGTSGSNGLILGTNPGSSPDVNDGVIRLAHSNAAGVGRIAVFGGFQTGRLELSGGINVANRIELYGRQGFAGRAAISNFSGTNTLSGDWNLTANGASMNIEAQSGSKLIINGNTPTGATGRTLTLMGSGEIEFSKIVNGTQFTAVRTVGSGLYHLTQDNTYAGATTVSAGGVLRISHANALGTAAGNTSISSGGALQIQGGITTAAEALALDGTGVSTTGALRNISDTNTYTGAITLNGATRINADASSTLNLDVASGNAITGTNHNLTFGGAGNIAVADAIEIGSGTLTKDGAGTLTLTNGGSYSGATNVNGGTLVVDGNISTSLVTVAGGATLAGTGTVGATTVNGTLAPGNSIGTLNISGALSLTSIANFEIDPTVGVGFDRSSDLANASGSVTYGGTLNVLYGGSASDFTNGMIFNLFNGSSFSGGFSAINLPSLTGGLSWQDNLLSNGTLTVIPEPSVALLGGLGLLALLRRRR